MTCEFPNWWRVSLNFHIVLVPIKKLRKVRGWLMNFLIDEDSNLNFDIVWGSIKNLWKVRGW